MDILIKTYTLYSLIKLLKIKKGRGKIVTITRISAQKSKPFSNDNNVCRIAE